MTTDLLLGLGAGGLLTLCGMALGRFARPKKGRFRQ
jgi:hypothetical protein